MTKLPSLLAVAALAALLGLPGVGRAQEIPAWLRDLKLPNSGAKSLMTPSAWGAAYGTAFVGAGVAERTPYSPSADGVMLSMNTTSARREATHTPQNGTSCCSATNAT